MKKHWNKKTFWQSLLSAIVLVIFVLLTTGTYDEIYKHERKEFSVGVEDTYIFLGFKTITFGNLDLWGRWNGRVRINKSCSWGGSRNVSTEYVNMIDGKRHGESITTFSKEDDKIERKVKYNMGNVEKPTTKTIQSRKADISAFQVLVNKYPWFLYSLNAIGYDSLYVKAYMDTFETKLSSYSYDVTKFDDYYGDVTDELEETPYDSIITLNSQLTMFQGLEAMKNSEFRLAIIDHNRSAGSTTFNIISTKYPGYLLNLNNLGVNNQDFKDFCQNMDTRMTSYGALDQQDPSFVDSLDARMFRAVLAISNAGKSSSLLAEPSVNSILLDYKNHDINDIYDDVLQMLKSSSSKSTPKEVATIVVNDMMWQYYIPAEIIRQAVMEAYFIKGGVKRVPTATTVFEGTNSATSVTLKGYVIEDGGASVTSRGIAWATYYNPTTNDNKAAQGTGTGGFPAILTGLTYGTTYYARTYATNSAGTAYGNCISFNTNITTAINDIKPSFTQDFSIYPNPASSSVTLNFKLESQGEIRLIVFDMKGKVLLNRDLGNLPHGENQVLMDLSILQNGIYICQLTKGTERVTQRLVISR